MRCRESKKRIKKELREWKRGKQVQGNKDIV